MLVEEISPKVEFCGPLAVELPALLPPGLSNDGWFRELNDSRRAWILNRSVTGKMREICASFWKSMGPLMVFLARFPNVPGATGFAQGLAALVALQKAFRLRKARVATVDEPDRMVFPVFWLTPGTAFGRSLPVSVSDMSCPSVTLIGAPLVMWRRGAISQSLANHLATP